MAKDECEDGQIYYLNDYPGQVNLQINQIN